MSCENVPVTNYSFWTSSEGVPHLVIDSDKELCEEFRLICDAIHQQDNQMDFKNYKDDERIFIKLNRNCEKISPNCSLTYCISVFGFFKKAAGGKTFLQFDVCEQETTKISLLGKHLSSISKILDNEVSEKRIFTTNYTPYSASNEFGSNW